MKYTRISLQKTYLMVYAYNRNTKTKLCRLRPANCSVLRQKFPGGDLSRGYNNQSRTSLDSDEIPMFPSSLEERIFKENSVV